MKYNSTQLGTEARLARRAKDQEKAYAVKVLQITFILALALVTSYSMLIQLAARAQS